MNPDQSNKDLSKPNEQDIESGQPGLKHSNDTTVNQKQNINVKRGIGRKIFSGFGIVGLLLTGAIIITLSSIDSLNKNIRLTYDHPLAVTRASTLIKFEIVQMHRSMKDVTLAETSEARNEYIKLVDMNEKEAIQLFDIVHQQILGDEGRELSLNAYKAFLDWQPIRERVIALAEAGDYREAQRITQTEGDNYVELLNAKVDKLIDYAANKAQVFNAESSNIANRTWFTALLTLSLSLFIGLVLTFIFTRDITNRLAIINAAALKMTEGVLDQSIQIKGKDELTTVADSFNTMASQLLQSYEALEDKVEQRTRKLMESETKYSTLTENLNVGIYRNTVGPTGKFIDVNSAFVKMFGYDSKVEISQINVSDLYQNPSDRAIYNNKMLKRGYVVNEELNFRKKDGTPFIGSIYSVAVKGDNDKVKYYDGIVEDITARKQAENALYESNQLKELLLDIITHDIKNPAGNISTMAEIMLEEDSDNEMLDIIKGSSDKLLQVMDNATTLAQVTLGDRIKLKEIDITEILYSVGKEISSQVKQSDMTLIIDVPNELIIKVNPIISEVFSNYINNAIKYARKGKQIIVDSEKQGGFLIINVKDFGTTISENKRSEVFDRGVQIDDKKKFGQGLGLAIVKRIAEAHNAEVGVKPNEPTGNIFYIKIPIN